MPSALQGGFQATPAFDAWHWCKIQKVQSINQSINQSIFQVLVSTAIQGILIGLAIVLVVLIVATRNIIVGLLGTLTICLITTCVIGVIPMAGWKIGVDISISVTIKHCRY
jgi:predicted RND superfamily exporter protein